MTVAARAMAEKKAVVRLKKLRDEETRAAGELTQRRQRLTELRLLIESSDVYGSALRIGHQRPHRYPSPNRGRAIPLTCRCGCADKLLPSVSLNRSRGPSTNGGAASRC